MYEKCRQFLRANFVYSRFEWPGDTSEMVFFTVAFLPEGFFSRISRFGRLRRAFLVLRCSRWNGSWAIQYAPSPERPSPHKALAGFPRLGDASIADTACRIQTLD